MYFVQRDNKRPVGKRYRNKMVLASICARNYVVSIAHTNTIRSVPQKKRRNYVYCLNANVYCLNDNVYCLNANTTVNTRARKEIVEPTGIVLKLRRISIHVSDKLVKDVIADSQRTISG